MLPCMRRPHLRAFDCDLYLSGLIRQPLLNQVAILEEVRLSSRVQQLALPAQVLQLAQRAWQRRVALVRRLWALMMVPAAFTVFLVCNGGVVLGDRAAHTPVKHLMQPLYFSMFSAGALLPVFFTPSTCAVHVKCCAHCFKKFNS